MSCGKPPNDIIYMLLGTPKEEDERKCPYLEKNVNMQITCLMKSINTQIKV